MEYIKVKGADTLVEKSFYVIKNPQDYIGKWSSLFNNNNPICIEIGMGRGDFILDMAKNNPKVNYIGIEINSSQMSMAIERQNSLKLNNVRFINMDALYLDKVFKKEIDTIYLTFPEPWPKPHNEKNRLTRTSYLKIYDKIFKKNKHIILKTDNKNYFAYSLMSLSNYWYIFDYVSLDLHHDEKRINISLTNYEKQYIKENRPIYYLDAKFED